MEDGNGKATIGLLILGVTGAFGIWSSLQTSPTGLFKFVAKDEDKQTEKVARDAMKVALALIFLMALGLWLVYRGKGVAAAVGTAVAGIFLFAYYEWLLQQGAKIRRGEKSRYSPENL